MLPNVPTWGFITLFLLILNHVPSQAQQGYVEGRIASLNDNYPLENIQVRMADSIVAVSDATGYFICPNVGNAELKFHVDGILIDSLTITNAEILNVRLTLPPSYEKKIPASVMIATSSATGTRHQSVFNRGLMQGPEQLIQGRFAGVQVTSANGDVGGFTQILIRGATSLYLNQPLYVLDGVPLNSVGFAPQADNPGAGVPQERNPLRFINPADIERIDVLKDGASAMYGTRGGNGVIFITTKNATARRKRVDYSSQLSIASVSKRYDLLGREEFLSAYSDAGGNPSAIDFANDTDWQSEVFRQSVSQKHDLSFSDQFKNTKLRASLGYENQSGVVQKSSMKRVSARANIQQQLLRDRLTVVARLMFSRITDHIAPVYTTGPDLISSVIRSNPTLPSDPGNDPLSVIKPTSWLQFTSDQTSSNIYWTNLTARYKLTDHFSATINANIDGSLSERRNAYTRELANISYSFNHGMATMQELKSTNRFLQAQLNYQKTFANGSFSAMLVVSDQRFKNTVERVQGWGFSSASLAQMTDDLDRAKDVLIGTISPSSYFNYGYNSSLFFASYLQPPHITTFQPPSNIPVEAVAGSRWMNDNSIRSISLQLSYTHKDKYFINGGLRRDLSNQFGSNHPHAFFPFANLAWTLSEENALKESGIYLKARLGYGVAGNANLFTNMARREERFADVRINSLGSIQIPGITPSTVGNPDLRPEKVTQMNVGFDLSTKDGRVGITLDVYNKVTKDPLALVPMAQPSVISELLMNTDATVTNKGIEISINTEWLRRQRTSIATSLVFSYNKSQVESMPGNIIMGEVNIFGLPAASTQRVISNGPLYQYYLANFTGFDDSGFSTGGSQQASGKSPIPSINAGFALTARYKRFSVGGLLAGQFGHYIYNNTASSWLTKPSLANGWNVTTDVVATGESPLNGPAVSTRFLEKGDFLRLQEIAIEYQLRPFSKKVQEFNICLVAQNLFVLTSYSGLDPEVNSSSRSAIKAEYGNDYASYPRPRIFSVRVEISF